MTTTKPSKFTFSFDESIAEWHRPILEEAAVHALTLYKEGSKKTFYRLECAIGRENRDVMGRWIVAKWHLSQPDVIAIAFFS